MPKYCLLFVFKGCPCIFYQNLTVAIESRGSLTSGAIRDYFRQLGFSDEELVALLGDVARRWHGGLVPPLNPLKDFESRKFEVLQQHGKN